MIEQTGTGLNSRSEANPYNEDGFLPLITAPMYSIVDENNYQIFLDNKVQVCLPRNQKGDKSVFHSLSLENFEDIYLTEGEIPEEFFYLKVCIDTANGNIPKLHESIRKAKEIHGDKLIIIAGNVASVEAFLELAKTGVNYIRVGIGGGGGCNTTSNTGVGQEDLEKLIRACSWHKNRHPTMGNRISASVDELQNISKVKIIADGISSYIKQCEIQYGFNDNGYAAINKLLFAGADLVMVGKLFAQCVESAGSKRANVKGFPGERWDITLVHDELNEGMLKLISRIIKENHIVEVKYSGMSTQEEQKKYKSDLLIRVTQNTKTGHLVVDRDFLRNGDILYFNNSPVNIISDCLLTIQDSSSYHIAGSMTFQAGDILILNPIKPSEGSVSWIPVRWTLDEWLNGSANQDEFPYLMGWINSIKSAMAYTGKTKL